MDKTILILILVKLFTTLVDCNKGTEAIVKPEQDNTTVKPNEDKCPLESDDIHNQNAGQASDQAEFLKHSFEVRLLKNELMLLRSDVEKLTGLDSRVDCLMSRVGALDNKLNRLENKLNNFENYPNSPKSNNLIRLEEKLTSLENKLDNNLGDLIDKQFIKINVNVTALTRLMVSLENRETEDNYSIKELRKELFLLKEGFKSEKEITHSKLQQISMDQDSIQELRKESILLKQGFESEKRSTHMKLQQIDSDMKNITDGILRSISHSLSDKVENMTQHMTDIDESVKENEQTVQNLGAEVAHLQNVSDEMYELKTVNKKISEEFLTLDKKYGNMESKLQTLTDDTAMINGSCNEIFSVNQRKSIFSALVDETTQRKRVTSTLIFDKLIFQTGTDYNVTSGVFTCPESAMYWFSVKITLTLNNYRLKVQLMVDSVITADIKRKYSYASTGTAIQALKKGQKVQININHSSYSRLYTSQFTNSSFTGGQLFRM